jgi:hypothetical protein
MAESQSRGVINTLLRQQQDVDMVKRDRWTEAEVDALPPGEHDYFERKSGKLLADVDELRGTLAKAASAFANSGGGHLILGVADDGTPDGVPEVRGKIAMRDWIEQIMPNLVSYPLSDFRVHVVDRSAPSRIPAGRGVIVVDFGDSALAPHQCAYGGGSAHKYVYYYREAGRSVPAPHFYLELLRQRVVNPSLEVAQVTPTRTHLQARGKVATVRYEVRITVKNVGRIVAKGWAFGEGRLIGVAGTEGADWTFQHLPGPFAIQPAVLPGCLSEDLFAWQITLAPARLNRQRVRTEVRRLIEPAVFEYSIATEFSPGIIQQIVLGPTVDAEALVSDLVEVLSRVWESGGTAIRRRRQGIPLCHTPGLRWKTPRGLAGRASRTARPRESGAAA